MTHKSLSEYTPSELILARSQAFFRGDFAFIFDTYHSESNFRRQFILREDYLDFGKTTLGQDYQITDCQVLDQREQGDETQVVFLMEMKVRGDIQKFAELAWLRVEADAWRYHRGLKIANEELPENPQSLSFADFERCDQSTVF